MEPRTILALFDDLLTEVDRIDLQLPEDSALLHLAEDLVPQVAPLLHEGLYLLSLVEQYYQERDESAEPEPAADSLQGIGSLISSEIAAQEITDLAFFARRELQVFLRELSEATRKPSLLKLASACEGGLKRLRTTLICIESTILEYEGFDPPTRDFTDLSISLETRQLYGKLRAIVGEEPPEDDQIFARLRAITHRLVALRELRIYPFLRFDDRAELRRLLRRILRWLTSATHDPQAGRRLWQDLSAFSFLLGQINHRQELREHDREVVERAYHSLYSAPEPPDRIPDVIFTQLMSLEGLDETLDELVRRQVRSPDRWRLPLRQARVRLRRPAVPPLDASWLG